LAGKRGKSIVAEKLYYTALVATAGLAVFSVSKLAENVIGMVSGLVLVAASPYISLFIVSRKIREERKGRLEKGV